MQPRNSSINYRTFVPAASGPAEATHSARGSSAGARGFRHTSIAAPVGTVYPSIIIQEPTLTVPRKAKRKRITQRQFEVLQGAFLVRDTPSHEVRAALAAQLDMSPREVQVWFQNRRAKYNRERALKKQKESQVNAAMAMIEKGQPAKDDKACSATATTAAAAADPGANTVARQATALTAAAVVSAVPPGHRHRSHSESMYQHGSVQPHPAGPYLPAGFQAHPSLRVHAYAHPHHHTLPATSPSPSNTSYYPGHIPRVNDGLTVSVPVAAAISPLQQTAPHTAPAHPILEQVPEKYSAPHISDHHSAHHNHPPSLAPARANSADSRSWGVYSGSNSAQATPILQSPAQDLPSLELGSVAMASCTASESSSDYVADAQHPYPSRRSTVSGPQMYTPTDGHISPAASGLMLGSISAPKARVRYASAVPSESSSQSRSSTRRSLSPRASSIRLPSIQAMLSSAGAAAANMHASSPHSPSSSRSARSRSHTSPMSMTAHQDSASAGPNLPPIHNLAHTAQAPAVGGARIHSTAQAADYRAARGRVQLLEIPLVDDLNARDVKFGIDMLATAAVSVSSGRADMPLPHLTPLAGFSHRTLPGFSRTNVRSQLPGTLSGGRQGSEQGQPRGVPTRKVTPTNNAKRKPSGTKWRPW